jgi:hypothetical protein
MNRACYVLMPVVCLHILSSAHAKTTHTKESHTHRAGLGTHTWPDGFKFTAMHAAGLVIEKGTLDALDADPRGDDEDKAHEWRPDEATVMAAFLATGRHQPSKAKTSPHSNQEQGAEAHSSRGNAHAASAHASGGDALEELRSQFSSFSSGGRTASSGSGRKSPVVHAVKPARMDTGQHVHTYVDDEPQYTAGEILNRAVEGQRKQGGPLLRSDSSEAGSTKGANAASEEPTKLRSALKKPLPPPPPPPPP